jgi:hypothetical protein
MRQARLLWAPQFASIDPVNRFASLPPCGPSDILIRPEGLGYAFKSLARSIESDLIPSGNPNRRHHGNRFVVSFFGLNDRYCEPESAKWVN